MTLQIGDNLGPDLAYYLGPHAPDSNVGIVLDEAATIRQRPIDIPLLGESISGLQRIPFELARLGLVSSSSNDIADILDLDLNWVEASRDAARTFSGQVVEHFAGRTLQLLKDNQWLEPLVETDPFGHILLASNIACQEGHAGQLRQSAPRYAYEWHPRAMQVYAQLGHIVVSPNPNEYEHQELRMTQCDDAVHDVIEIPLSKGRYEALVEPHILAPQDMGGLALRFNVSSDIAHELVDDVHSFIKMPLGDMEFYNTSVGNMLYIAQLTPRAKVGKQTDMADNKNNPKAPEFGGMPSHKEENYSSGMEMIPVLLRASGDNYRARWSTAIKHVDVRKARAFFTQERDTAHDVAALLRPAA